MTIPEVKDEEIFIKTNSLTNMIKGKKLRKRMLDHNIRMEIKKVSIPMFLGFTSDKVELTIHRPAATDKTLVNEIIHLVSTVIMRRHDVGMFYNYVDTE